MIDLSHLQTEQRNPATMHLDQLTPLEIAQAMSREDGKAVAAVASTLPQIATAMTWAAESFGDGGRLIYIGAGTSGRLGLLDAVECPPTFGVSANTVVGIIAGGRDALIAAKEGAEDDPDQGKADLQEIDLSSVDLVVGLAASGRTPYVAGALEYARKLGCRTISIACVSDSKIGTIADLAIEAVTGPEVLTGSTRLKAGTAQKLILNMISTGSMTLSGKVYQNLMVDVKQSNEKLRSRAMGIIMAATDCCEKRAAEALADAEGSVKIALTSILLNTTTKDAREALATSEGHVRRAMEQGGD